MDRHTVYGFYDNEPRFTGTEQECMTWIFDQADTLSDGRRIYRTWVENGKTAYDVGRVYYVK